MELTDMVMNNDCELDDDCQVSDLECEKTFVECICPKCGVRHKLKLCWTGSGVPRKFCTACRKSALNYDLDEVFTVSTSSNNE